MHIVRRAIPTEYHKYRAHLKALDAESRYLRFTSAASDAFIDKLCDAVESDTARHVLFAIEDADLNFVAVAHIAIFDETELAFSVSKECQGQGMGQSLMRRAIQYCRTHEILTGHMVCLQTNAAMKKLCSRNNVHVETECGESTGVIELDKANALTYFEEAASANLGVFDYLSKRTMRPWSILAQ